jgi:hypothetical protein
MHFVLTHSHHEAALTHQGKSRCLHKRPCRATAPFKPFTVEIDAERVACVTVEEMPCRDEVKRWICSCEASAVEDPDQPIASNQKVRWNWIPVGRDASS